MDRTVQFADLRMGTVLSVMTLVRRMMRVRAVVQFAFEFLRTLPHRSGEVGIAGGLEAVGRDAEVMHPPREIVVRLMGVVVSVFTRVMCDCLLPPGDLLPDAVHLAGELLAGVGTILLGEAVVLAGELFEDFVQLPQLLADAEIAGCGLVVGRQLAQLQAESFRLLGLAGLLGFSKLTFESLDRFALLDGGVLLLPFPFQFLPAPLARRFGPFALRDGSQLVRLLPKCGRFLLGSLPGEHLCLFPQGLGPFESLVGLRPGR